MTPPASRKWLLFGLYSGTMVVWGLNFIFVKVGLASSPPLWLAAFRALLGTGGIAVLLWMAPASEPMGARERRDALLLGFPTTGLFFGLWFSAASHVPPGETAVLVYTFPLWVVILSFLLLNRLPRPVAGVSVAVGFLGVILMEQPWSGPSGRVPLVEVAELLGAAAAWAIGTVLLKARISRSALRTANGYQLASGTAVLLVAAALLEPNPMIHVTGSYVVSLVWLGLVGTALSNAAWFILLGRFSATTVSTWAFLTPVVALIASVLIFAESLDALQVVGIAAILSSAVAIARADATLAARE